MSPSLTRDSPRSSIAIVALDAAATGSVAGVVRLQAELLAERFNVTVISRSVPEDSALSYRTVGVPTASLVSWRRFGHAAREWWAGRRLIAEVLAQHRDRPIHVAIIHSHTLAALGARRLARAGIRTILIAHADIRKRPRGTYDPLLTRLYRWSTPRAYSRVDRVVALCEEYAELARGEARSPERVRVIPCPVAGPWPAIPISCKRPAGTAAPVRIGFAGRLAVEKDLGTLLRAVALLNEEGVRCQLMLAGEGPLRKELEKLADRLDLSDSVEFLGWLPGGELADFYDRLDLFCLPSISESQGLVAQEGLLHGVPVIASRLGPLVDTVRPGRDGELFDPRNIEGLAHALQAAVSCLQSGGYVVPDPTWMERFSPATHGKRISELILELTE